MFLGQCWMTLPMTATGSTYYKLYNKFFNKLLQLEKLEKTKEDDSHKFLQREQVRLTHFYRQLKTGEERLLRLMKYLKRPYRDNDDDDDDQVGKTSKSIILKEFDSIVQYLVKLFGAENSIQVFHYPKFNDLILFLYYFTGSRPYSFRRGLYGDSHKTIR
jgi:hypothetical protein